MSSPLTARLKSLAFDARLSPALIRWLNRLDIDLQYTALDAGNPNAQLLKTLNKEELSRLYRAIKRHMEVWAGARVSSKNATRDRWQRSVGTQIMKLEWPEGSVQLSLTTDSMSFRTHAMNSDLSVHIDYGVRPIALILVELEGYVRLIRRAMVVRGQLERGAERTIDRVPVAGPLADAYALMRDNEKLDRKVSLGMKFYDNVVMGEIILATEADKRIIVPGGTVGFWHFKPFEHYYQNAWVKALDLLRRLLLYWWERERSPDFYDLEESWQKLVSDDDYIRWVFDEDLKHLLVTLAGEMSMHWKAERRALEAAGYRKSLRKNPRKLSSAELASTTDYLATLAGAAGLRRVQRYLSKPDVQRTFDRMLAAAWGAEAAPAAPALDTTRIQQLIDRLSGETANVGYSEAPAYVARLENAVVTVDRYLEREPAAAGHQQLMETLTRAREALDLVTPPKVAGGRQGERWTYGALHRPPVASVLPDGVILEPIGAHPDFPMGTASYPYGLQPSDRKKWGLVLIPTGEQIGQLVSRLADRLDSYRQEYIEVAEEDLSTLAPSVGGLLDDMGGVHIDRGYMSRLVLAELKRRQLEADSKVVSAERFRPLTRPPVDRKGALDYLQQLRQAQRYGDVLSYRRHAADALEGLLWIAAFGPVQDEIDQDAALVMLIDVIDSDLSGSGNWLDQVRGLRRETFSGRWNAHAVAAYRAWASAPLEKRTNARDQRLQHPGFGYDGGGKKRVTWKAAHTMSTEALVRRANKQGAPNLTVSNDPRRHFTATLRDAKDTPQSQGDDRWRDRARATIARFFDAEDVEGLQGWRDMEPVFRHAVAAHQGGAAVWQALQAAGGATDKQIRAALVRTLHEGGGTAPQGPLGIWRSEIRGRGRAFIYGGLIFSGPALIALARLAMNLPPKADTP
jgi:hypothetical protein